MCLCGEENKLKGKDLANTDATLNDLFPIKKKKHFKSIHEQTCFMIIKHNHKSLNKAFILTEP